jgi:hypothetical protein
MRSSYNTGKHYPGVTGSGYLLSKRKAEEIRIRALYRDLVLKKRIVLSGEKGRACLMKLVGPDCAYHLYRNLHTSDE